MVVADESTSLWRHPLGWVLFERSSSNYHFQILERVSVAKEKPEVEFWLKFSITNIFIFLPTSGTKRSWIVDTFFVYFLLF